MVYIKQQMYAVENWDGEFFLDIITYLHEWMVANICLVHRIPRGGVEIAYSRIEFMKIKWASRIVYIKQHAVYVIDSDVAIK